MGSRVLGYLNGSVVYVAAGYVWVQPGRTALFAEGDGK